ncbi:MAG: membrane protein insertase YidC [Candidatus Brocadiales bacterium]
MDRQAFLGLVIGSLTILVYYALFLPWMFPPEKRHPAPRVTKAPTQKAAKAPQPTRPPVEIEERILKTLPSTGVPLVDNIVLENEALKTTWSNKGAVLKDVTLKKYRDYTRTKDLHLFLPSNTSPHTLAIDEILGKYDLSNYLYQAKEVTPERISFQATLENGLRLTKNISLHKGAGYHIDIEILLENTAKEELPVRYSIVSASQIYPEGIPEYDMASVIGVSLRTKTKLIQKTLGELKKSPEKNESHGIAWAGGVNKYFACVLKPSSNNLIYSVSSRLTLERNTKQKENLAVSAETSGLTLLPGGSEKHSYILFLGPKKEEILQEYGLVKLLNFGAFTPISKGLLHVLKAFYNVIPNYGVGIIILTILVKALLFPLTRKSQMSMFKMQKLQPQLKEIQEKYKKDKQKMGQEQMALFKRHGVNPMSGCLPIILQLPIFYALFRTLQLSFEMRLAPFALWIQDLSRPDMLYTTPFTMPFLGNHVNALPIIMAIASVAQMKLMPTNPDPKARQQQQLMKFMPIMFAFVLYHFPSGLLLYWTVSTILSVGEQLLIRRMVAKLK